jgi:hypothetical protein
MFKPFFYHYNRGPGKLSNREPRGFTAHFKPMDMSQRHVWMSVAWCSPKDEFNKKVGRETAMNKDYKLVPIREVPGLLAGAENICRNNNVFDHVEEKFFYWIYRYFL